MSDIDMAIKRWDVRLGVTATEDDRQRQCTSCKIHLIVKS